MFILLCSVNTRYFRRKYVCLSNTSMLFNKKIKYHVKHMEMGYKFLHLKNVISNQTALPFPQLKNSLQWIFWQVDTFSIINQVLVNYILLLTHGDQYIHCQAVRSLQHQDGYIIPCYTYFKNPISISNRFCLHDLSTFYSLKGRNNRKSIQSYSD